jgi:hypothetical protein
MISDHPRDKMNSKCDHQNKNKNKNNLKRKKKKKKKKKKEKEKKRKEEPDRFGRTWVGSNCSVLNSFFMGADGVLLHRSRHEQSFSSSFGSKHSPPRLRIKRAANVHYDE